jgi:NAD+ kinase
MLFLTGHFERPKVRKLLEKTIGVPEKNKARFEFGNIAGIKNKKNYSKILCAIAIGGDGTLLRTAREFSEKIPIAGIGCGEKNFLMKIKPWEIEKKLVEIAKGRFKTEEKERLETIIDGKKAPLALNEALLVNKKSGAIIKYKIKLNGKKIAENSADGIIVCTSTGSTGHALSAGGKKIPNGFFEIVQYNAMGKKPKPIIAKANSKIEITCLGKYAECETIIDGQPRFKTEKNIIIKKGKNIKLVKLN